MIISERIKIIVILLVILICISLVIPAYAAGGKLTARQTKILKIVMAKGINRKLHYQFWSDIPRQEKKLYKKILQRYVLALINTTLKKQRAFWESADLSYDMRKVVEIKDLYKYRRQLYTGSFLPGLTAKQRRQAVASYRRSYKKELRTETNMLKAAAQRKCKMVYSKAKQKKVKICMDKKLIKAVQSKLNSIFYRVKLLMDPVWRGD